MKTRKGSVTALPDSSPLEPTDRPYEPVATRRHFAGQEIAYEKALGHLAEAVASYEKVMDKANEVQKDLDQFELKLNAYLDGLNTTR